MQTLCSHLSEENKARTELTTIATQRAHTDLTRAYKQAAPEDNKADGAYYRRPFLLTGAPLEKSWIVVSQLIGVFVTRASP